MVEQDKERLQRLITTSTPSGDAFKEDRSKLREWLTSSPEMTYKYEDFFATAASPKYDRKANTEHEPEPEQLTAKPTTLAPSHQDWS